MALVHLSSKKPNNSVSLKSVQSSELIFLCLGMKSFVSKKVIFYWRDLNPLPFSQSIMRSSPKSSKSGITIFFVQILLHKDDPDKRMRSDSK